MVKVHQLVAAIATTFTLSTTGAYALNMGEISWKSSYGQPLNARIELSDTAGLKATDIKVSLATNAEFAKAGIDHSNELSKLIFTTILGKDGKAYIQVTSNSPIKEPYLDFLVNVNFQGNKLSKDYTILMDLPDTNSKNTSTQTKNKADKTAVTASSNTSESYRAQRGDTLWSVAEKLHGNNSAAKAATAIYKKNPKAFINGSANHLIAGYSLKVPTDQEVKAISVMEANTFIQSTHSSTTTNTNNKQPTTAKIDKNAEKNQAAQLENKLKTSEQQLNDARVENDELSTKLEQLQAEISKLDEVSKLKDDQIKSIQAKITEQQVAPENKPVAETKPASETNPVTETKSAPVTKPVSESKPAPETKPVSESKPAPETKPVSESTPAPETKPVTETKPTPKLTPAPVPVDDSLLFGLDTSTLTKIGGGVLLVLCIAALLLRRKKANAEVTEVDLSHVMLDSPENLKSSEQTLQDPPATSTDDVDSPFTHLDEEANIIDKADIYLAYNRYTEAKDLLTEAINADPSHNDYRLKLLEVYAEQGDSANFEAVAQELLLLDPLAQQKVDTLKKHYSTLTNAANTSPVGKEALFADTLTDDSVAGEVTSTVNEQDVHANLENEPLASETSEVDATVFNFDAKPTEEDPLEKANANFHLDTIHNEPAVEDKPLFSTTEPDYDFNADSPIYEFGHEEPQIKETAKEEDFKFDLGIGQETLVQDKLPEEKTAAGWSSFVDSFAQSPETVSHVEEEASVADHLDEIIEKDQVTTKLELVQAYIEMNDTEGAHDLLNEILQEGNDAQKAEAKQLLASLDTASIISETSAPSEPAQPITPLETTEVVTANPTLEVTPEASLATTTNKDPSTPLNIDASAAELDLGFKLPPEDEVSTKIELARAYIDMGDTNGARDILDEVLKEGNADQKKQAEQLITTLS